MLVLMIVSLDWTTILSLYWLKAEGSCSILGSFAKAPFPVGQADGDQ
ncbi:hypothetical protein BLGI_1698 [Brevibacillus laterosporus GI-9]|nr:hypothetical protein BLGI_1698 [Brevibacillus laterosporus GI-9]